MIRDDVPNTRRQAAAPSFSGMSEQEYGLENVLNSKHRM